MDSRNHFIKEFSQWIAMMDEEYLIGIANKGIYNRSIKDLQENPCVAVEVGDGVVTCALPDGNTCTLVSDIKKYKCTCPSRTVCKHVIMALLHIKQNAGSLLGTSEAVPEPGVCAEEKGVPGYTVLLDIKPEELKKRLGDKEYEEILFRMGFGVSVEIEEGTLLTVRFVEEGITVKFPPMESVRDAICSCKSKEFCRHKAEALLYWQLQKGRLIADNLKVEHKVSIPADTLEDVKKYIFELLVLGLSRLPVTAPEGMEQWAIICHNAGLANLEKQFRRLKREAELYFAKDAGFSRSTMLGTLTRVWGICTALQEKGIDSEMAENLMGEHKSAYHDIPPIELYGMGAEGWMSKAGFEGITFYFYNMRLKKWMTYTNARPTYYEGRDVSLGRMYKAAPPWGVEGSQEQFSKSRIRLAGGKMNQEGRLSSSSEAAATVTGRTDPWADFFKETLHDKWNDVFAIVEKSMAYSLEEREANMSLMLLKIAVWGESSFDKVEQRFCLPIYDEEQRQLFVSLKYTGGNQLLIQKLENLEKAKNLPPMVLGRIYIEDGQMNVVPIAGYYPGGRIVNLTLD